MTARKDYFYIISRSAQVAVIQLRFGFCNLNFNIDIKICVGTGNCECGHIREDSKYYLLQCSNFTSQQSVMLD